MEEEELGLNARKTRGEKEETVIERLKGGGGDGEYCKGKEQRRSGYKV